MMRNMHHALRRRSTLETNRGHSIKGRIARVVATTCSGIVLSMASAHAASADLDHREDGSNLTNVDELASLDSQSLAEHIFPKREEAETREPAAPDASTAGPVSVVEQAGEMIGIPYHWGGNNPEEGLDCSGFVRYVYRKTTGLLLPRQSAQISRAGSAVAKPDLHPGDLVFFDTPRGPATHVGIYMGDHRFIHAPKTGAFIRVESMTSPYWAVRYHGARRFST
jgi:cell wall-associated NlpC family hydrolase